ncbi:MAG: methyltransferase domain-containing protein, partial [Gammaproteobacteria bacterium]
RGLIRSIRKEWYRHSMRGRLSNNDWAEPYWYERDGLRVVACRMCPKFDSGVPRCSIPYGTPLRKCVVAATEAHLRNVKPGMEVLELGFGRRSLARHIVELRGARWTGIEPEVEGAPRLGEGGFGHTAAIAFADETFDLICGIQSFEHWAEAHPKIPHTADHASCLREIWRALKPGGVLYLDAPIHVHGHEMFVLGDYERILGHFDERLWEHVIAEIWRADFAPLARYAPPDTDARHWSETVTSADAATLESIRRKRSAHLFTVNARKRIA